MGRSWTPFMFSHFLYCKEKIAQLTLEYNNSQWLRKIILCRPLCQVSVTRATFNYLLTLKKGEQLQQGHLCVAFQSDRLAKLMGGKYRRQGFRIISAFCRCEANSILFLFICVLEAKPELYLGSNIEQNQLRQIIDSLFVKSR